MILSAFFSKSKPINYIIVGAYMVLFYSFLFYQSDPSLTILDGTLAIAGLGAYIFCMLGTDFIAKRNELCKSNSYTILLFAVVSTLLPVALLTPKIILACAACVLAMRRIISLRSQRAVQKKILDASLWIMLASICYFWSILFFGLLFLGIGLYVGQNYRNWLIPLIGVIASYVIVTCINLLIWDNYFSFSSYIADFSIFFVAYTTNMQWVSFGLLITLGLLFLAFYLLKYKSRQTKTKPAVVLVISSLLIGTMILLVAPQKNTAELFFMTVPIALMGVSYLESGIKPLIKEILLWVLIVTPIIKIIF